MASPDAEERLVVRHAPVPCAALGQISVEHFTDARAERHQAVFAKFGVANDEKSPLPIDIAHVEMTGLTHAQAEAVERREDSVERRPAKLCPRHVREARGRVEQPAGLLGCEDERDSRRPCPSCRATNW